MSQNFELLSQIGTEFRSVNAGTTFSPPVIKSSEYLLNEHKTDDLLRLAQAVFLSGNTVTPHVVVICGIDEKSGSSQICIELSKILVLRGCKSVCLIDGNVSTQRLSKALDINEPTIRTASQRDARVQCSPRPCLATANVFDPNGESALAPASLLRQVIADLRSAYDFIIIDAPGVNVHGDCVALGQVADATILVIEANTTRKSVANKAKTALEAMNVRLIGAVLNDRIYPIPEPIYRRI